MIIFGIPANDASGLQEVLDRLRERGLEHGVVRPNEHSVLVWSDDDGGDWAELAPNAAVRTFGGPFGLVARECLEEPTRIDVGHMTIGGDRLAVIAGPCSVESPEQVDETAQAVARAGARGLRGGAFKPRTSPYAFQGLGEEGLRILAEAGRRHDLPVVTEVMSPDEVSVVAEYADVLQVGSRNVQNFRLLEAVAACDKPVLLKRGMMSTLDEFLGAAEYVVKGGNPRVVLCERGIRGFEPRLRNTLDLGAVALLKRLTHLPVLVDPSHACGLSELVIDLARAAVAVGADGLLVEVHPRPSEALSDGRQSLTPAEFSRLMSEIAPVAAAVGRRIS